MYILKIGEDIFFKPGVENLALVNPKVELELNNSGSLSFTMPPSHEFYDKVDELITYIELYDDNDEWIWGFRILEIQEDFYKNKVVTCEGWLSFLVDTIMRPFEFTGNIGGMFGKIITTHNAQVEKDKQFTRGQVTVTDSNNYINRSSGNYLNNLEVLKTRLVNTHGGYIRVRKVNGVKYLDYINDYNSINDQVIRFGENLLDLKKYTKAESVKTAIIPLGAELEDEKGINGVPPRLTIESVNNGKDYLIDEEAAKTWGYVWGTVDFDDVTLASNLLTKAKAQLKELIFSELILELNAVDLSYVDVNAEKIRLGDWITIESIPHDLQKRMLVNKLVLNLNEPSKDQFSLGGTIKSFTSSTNNRNREISLYAEHLANSNYNFINQVIEHQTDLLTGGYGGYVFFGTNDDGFINEIYIMDTPDKDTAKQVLRINLNGIGFSSSGVNGPYGTAWTLDGVFNANYITAGILKGIQVHQYSNNNRSISLNNNKLDVYSWESAGDYVGSVGSTFDKITSRQYMSMWCDKGDKLIIGSLADDGTINHVISFDSNTIDSEPPFIANTAGNSTIFPNNPNGGIKIKNGLITEWGLFTTSGTVPLGTGHTLTFKDGLLVNVS